MPWLGFVCAVLSLFLTLFIWMVSPFGRAALDSIAMLCALSFGVVTATAGCISGLRRFERAEGSDSQQSAGCIFGVLNLLIGIVLALAIWRCAASL